jgi:hypothetical protein
MVPTVQEAGWAPQTFWFLRGREKFLYCQKFSCGLPARNPVTTVTELYRLTTSLNPLREKVKLRTFLPSLSDFGQRLAFNGSQASAMCLAGTGVLISL